MRLLRAAFELFRDTFREWSAAGAPRLGAALSYYTVFSLAPVLLLVTAAAGLVFGAEAAQGALAGQLSSALGPQAASIIQTVLAKTSEPKQGLLATLVGIATLLLGATGVMLELQHALDTVFRISPKPNRGIKGVLKDRVIGLGLLMSVGFLSIVSLAASTALATFGQVIERALPGAVVLGYLLNLAFSMGVIAAFFALLLKVLPDARIAWRDLWVGASFTAGLFHIGKLGLEVYLARASVVSVFGAAGSLAVLLLWVYYSSQIVLFGATFTRLYAERFGSAVLPDDDALPQDALTNASRDATHRTVQTKSLRSGGTQ